MHHSCLTEKYEKLIVEEEDISLEKRVVAKAGAWEILSGCQSSATIFVVSCFGGFGMGVHAMTAVGYE